MRTLTVAGLPIDLGHHRQLEVAQLESEEFRQHRDYGEVARGHHHQHYHRAADLGLDPRLTMMLLNVTRREKETGGDGI